MFLDSTLKSLELVLGSAVTTTAMPITVDYVDLTTTTTVAGSTDTQSNGVTAVTILAAPAASTTRKVNGITVYNADSVSKVVTIRLNNNATLRVIISITLQVGETIGYTDTGGWYTQDVNGCRKIITSTQLGTANTWTAQQTFTQSSIVPSLPFNDNSTQEANTAFVQSVQGLNMATLPLANITGGTFSFAGLGSGCTLTYTVTTGAISSITSVAAGGSGYAVGDCLLVSGGNYDSVIRVATITGSAVATVTILYGGTGYSNGTAVATANALADPYKWRLSGTLTSNATFILPNGTYLTQSDQYIIANNTTGAFTVSFFVSNGSNATTGTGVVVAQGTGNNSNTLIETDGVSNVWFASSATGDFNPLSVTTNGVSTGITVSNNNVTTANQVNIGGTNTVNLGSTRALNIITTLSGGAASSGLMGFQNNPTFTPAVAGVTLYGMLNIPVFNSANIPASITAAFSRIDIGASALGGTIATAYCYQAQASINASATTNITTFNSYFGQIITQGALQTITNVYVFRGAQTAGTSRWNLYCDGSAINYLNGALLIGTTTDDTVSKLQVNGGSLITGMTKETSKSVTSTASLTTFTVSVKYSYLTGAAGASFAVTLPAAAASIDGEKIVIMSTATRASTTWASAGGSVVGAPATLTANTPVALQYNHADTTWYITL